MLQVYSPTEIQTFDKTALQTLEPCFAVTATDEKTTWFHNLLTLSQQSLGLAHCVQHNATARYLVELSHQTLPAWYQADFSSLIGCYSSHKQMDTMKLINGYVTGKKYWITNLAQSDYGIMRMPTGDTETYVLFDFTQFEPSISFECDQLGLELARPGTLTLDRHQVPQHHILGSRGFLDNDSIFVAALGFHDYCFITNYLGCMISLYDSVCRQAQAKSLHIQSELDTLRLEIATLKMLWEDNLDSITLTKFDDKFWHRRNTQYTKSKQTLIRLISVALSLADSSWTQTHGTHNQNFRDALVFSTHMQSLYRNLADKHFVGF